MARLPRLSCPGLPHLVGQWGHNGRPVFADDADRAAYRAALDDAARACGVAIHAYALLDERVLLLVTPETADGLSRMMQRVARRYGMAFNARHGGRGTLWEGRFRSTVVDPDEWLLRTMTHLEASAGEGQDAHDTSSLAHHLGQRRDPLITDHPAFWRLGNTPFEREAAYKACLLRSLSPADRERVDAALHKGWPLGPPAFLARLAAGADRPVSPRRPGRPRRRGGDEEALPADGQGAA